MKSKRQLKREAKKAKRMEAKRKAAQRNKVLVSDKGTVRYANGELVGYIERSESHLHQLGAKDG